eukprot:CAMPEP_0175073604 /NCGR_PEP_ID=MMETSP0052_2-20121109/20695_1 /TAXON_ID=51329 ORGANISM="Polytomella parva, Strain SAG 63-3" /NCGR_SAMPLE_ID=MMETSP0052_2 /ASSEMBLY_ACC=CAM_ASM_000194 /LENGTH=78 /DNA_ID=CAMNT_0016341513 /DNA_START=93 /DNA_END=329 /DNA_ORIENTATION=+
MEKERKEKDHHRIDFPLHGMQRRVGRRIATRGRKGAVRRAIDPPHLAPQSGGAEEVGRQKRRRRDGADETDGMRETNF